MLYTSSVLFSGDRVDVGSGVGFAGGSGVGFVVGYGVGVAFRSVGTGVSVACSA